MIIMPECLTEVELEPTAQANKSDPFKSTRKSNVPKSAGEESEIPQQPKNKAHCFCPFLAAEHGEESAVIFQGLGYKVAKSKKVHNDRKWHYDTLEALEGRWPYLSDSGIGGILGRHAEEGRVFKGHFNPWRPDRTNWYSMSDDLIARALDDDGKLWFDVAVAIRCHSIIAGTLYQNLRYHLLLHLAENPEFRDIPYHRINKAGLARVLPWSLSTIKRGYKELRSNELVAENPERAGEYTICNESDLVVPEAMMSSAKPKRVSRSGSSVERNGSSTEMGIGSSAEMTGSSTEKIGSSTGEIGSNTVSNNHLKPFEKHIHRHHSPTVGGVDANAADAAKGVHQDIGNEPSSAPVPGKENGSEPLDLDTIRIRIATLLPRISDSEQATLKQWAPGLAQNYILDVLTYETMRNASACADPAEVTTLVIGGIRGLVYENGAYENWNPDKCELCILWCLEIVAGVLSIKDGKLHKKLDHWLPEVDGIYRNGMPHFVERSDASPEAKAEMLIEEICFRNKEGWPTYKSGDVKFNVSSSDRNKSAAEQFFRLHSELSAENVWAILSDCVEVQTLRTKPTGFDLLWKTRQGVRPAFLFNYWEEINAEIDAARPLAA
ncbi:MAG: hypothetical protein ABJF10_10265 [Chthoniobacter sp.]|uniref:hypothetical protein n=1 Tax=Chthoniobacter sp. TaxID=2510640 RepID=UPI0032AC3DD3